MYDSVRADCKKNDKKSAFLEILCLEEIIFFSPLFKKNNLY